LELLIPIALGMVNDFFNDCTVIYQYYLNCRNQKCGESHEKNLKAGSAMRGRCGSAIWETNV